MKIYKVTTTGYNAYSKKDFSFYVLESDMKEAGVVALKKVKKLGLDKVDDAVTNVELIADESLKNEQMLVIDWRKKNE